MKCINLIFWYGEDNFGDQLSPFLVQKILQSKKRIVPKEAYKPYRYWLKHIIKKVLGYYVEDTNAYLKPYESSLLAVGSMLTFGNKKSRIWGSGFMNEFEKYNGGKVYAVRGKLSNQKIIEQGGKGCDVFGDPALLLPLFVKASKEKVYPFAIIPHWKETDFFIEKYGDQYPIIDFRTKDVLNVVEKITSCQAILSTSLHGIIVAHAYNIPAIWIKEGYIDTDGFKFADYFSSVNIKYYTGFENYDEIIHNNELRMRLFGSEIALPHVDLSELQRCLLGAFPYRV